MTKEPLTVEDLGELIPCQHCGRPTYRLTRDDQCGRLLPEGFTAGDRRWVVRVRGVQMTVCENCRYNVFGRW
jgi:hypothetical protein